MKLLKYGLPFAALAMLASCSNDNDVTPNLTPEPVQGDGMYMTVNIGLPAGLGSRASLTDYDEGDPNEYDVKDIKMYMFKLSKTDVDAGENPDEKATYDSTIKIGFSTPDEAPEVDVTRKYAATFHISGIKLNLDKTTAEGEEYYGLLVVNNPNNKITPPEDGVTFKTWNENLILKENSADPDYTDVMIQNGYFTMTNAPQVDGEPNALKPFTLVKLDTQRFAEDPNQATLPAAEFFIQRGVAKVTLGASTGKNLGALAVETNSNDEVKIENWALDVTNQVSYAVQNVAEWDIWYALPKKNHFYAMAGDGDQGMLHAWWGIDPNYRKTNGAQYHNNFTSLQATDGSLVNLDTEESVYCLENTMDYTDMFKLQTTRVVLKATYKIGKQEYTPEDAGFMVYAGRAIKVKKADLASAYVPTEGEPNKYVAAKGKKALKDLIDNSKKTSDADDALLSIEYYRQSLKAADYDEEVTFYPNGETFYVAYIRHFDDTEAQFDNVDEIDFSEFNAYTEAHKNLVGRYGILRNNSYQVLLKSVYGYGSPDIPVPDPDEPDDKTPEKEYNANIDINILNWARREFNYTPR